MTKKKAEEKSCGPKLTEVSTPTAQWSQDQLGDYARTQHQAILAGEKRLTPSYWRLGQALTLAKRNFNSGQLGKQLEVWAIDKTRASKARAIFASFKTPAEVETLSVEEAYQQRERKQKKPSKKRTKPSGTEHSPSLKEFFTEITTWSDRLLEEATTTNPKTADELLPEVTAAITSMKQLKAALERQSVAE